ncbi:YfjI family protein [Serratia proteamaculans]|uniref:YfjI family protein n=1 Tax=Serratia proteamaculans TaxID=28151 RepID=UPI0039AF6811
MALSPEIFNSTLGHIQPVHHSPQPISSVQQQTLSYPIEAFPPVLRQVIQALHADTQIPIELIGNTVLTAASLASQSHVEVIQSHMTTAEPCSLYFLTIAESGEGKSTINKKVMDPFYTFSEKVKLKHQEQLLDYNREHKLWKIKSQALNNLYKRAIEKKQSGEEEIEDINEHALIEPKKPHCPTMLYEDATPKTLMQHLSEYPIAGLLSDEAIIFFKGYVKNSLGLLNKLWDGGTYAYSRPDGEAHDIKACLTLSLMVQPQVLKDYLNKNEDIAKGSGFLSRFLFSNPISTIGYRRRNDDHSESLRTLNIFHERISHLLDKQYTNFNSNITQKKMLTLCDEAIVFHGRRRAEIEGKMASGQAWEHIRDVASKAGANTIRLAAIFTAFEGDESSIISAPTLERAHKIIDWHLHQASEFFYPMSESYQFEQDVYDLFAWIKNKFIENNCVPFLKNDLKQRGPNRLRHAEKLTPVLMQLVSFNLIGIVQGSPGGAHYIAMPNFSYKNKFIVPNGFSPTGNCFIFASQANTPGRPGKFDSSRLKY